MKKTWFILIILLIVIGLLVLYIYYINGYFDDETEPDVDEVRIFSNTIGEWQNYSNTRYGFSVEYPPDWILGEAPTNNDGRTFTSEDGKVTCHAYGFQNALFNEEGNPQTLDQFIDWLLSDPTTESIQEEETTMAGEEAREVIYGQTGKAYRDVYIMLDDDTGRGLSCNYENLKDEGLFRKGFKQMKKSFTLN
ncbi:MAG: PsbP-related protein [bacterium]